MSTNSLPADDRDPFEGGQPLDEYLLAQSGALGPAKDWTDMSGHALDTMDTMIATSSVVPDLFQQTPTYFLNALRSRMVLLTQAIDAQLERRTSQPDEANSIRDTDLTPQLETRARFVREIAQARALAWLNGLNPDDYEVGLVARSLEDDEDKAA
jgi:hypothetical protein